MSKGLKSILQVAALATFAGATSSAFAAGPAPSAEPTGLWYDHTGRGAIEITKCGGNQLCGNLVWVKDTNHKKGCGLQIFGEAKPVAAGRWDNGWIIDPEKDLKTRYDVEITPQGEKLKVMGYAGVKFLSETMIWTRAPANLQKCTEVAARAPEPAPAPAPTPTPAPNRGDDKEPPSVYPPPAATPAPASPPTAANPEPPKPAPREAPTASAKPKDCKVEFAGISLTFPCPE